VHHSCASIAYACDVSVLLNLLLLVFMWLHRLPRRMPSVIEQWRQLEAHRSAQTRAGASIFRTIASKSAGAIRGCRMFEREQVPTDSREIYE